MKIQTDPRLPFTTAVKWSDDLTFQLTLLFRDMASQVNGMAEGRIHNYHNADTAAPTTGEYQQGDFVLNSTPSELGTAGSKYLIHGWRCVSSGTPGTWKDMRFLTGG